MIRKHTVLLLGIAVAVGFCMTGCASVQYETFDTKDDSEWSDKDYSAYEEMVSDGAKWIGFETSNFVGSQLNHGEHNSERGVIKVIPENTKHSPGAYEYKPEKQFQSVTVCWRLNSEQGHLILWVPIDGYGMPTFMNDAHGYGGHVHLDSLDGDTEGIGWKESSFYRGKWIIQEIVVEGKDIVFKRNGKEFTRYTMDRPRKLSSFTIGTNDGGAGEIDYVVVK